MAATKHVAGGTLVVALAIAGVGMATAAEPQYNRPGNQGMVRHLINGTYQLETNRGDDPRRAAEAAARAVPPAQRQRTYESLLARLEAPEVLRFERVGNRVTMASTRGSRITIDADGSNRAERWSAERTMNTRASFDGERLVVATTGYRSNAFTVTFDPTRNGSVLRMTRTIDDERLRRPVTVRNFYRRVADDARWESDVAGSRGTYGGNRRPAADYVVPEGVRFVAVLDNDLTTTRLREGEPCTMTVHSPDQYQGAVIQGFVSTVDRSRRPGGAELTLNLQGIRLRDGNSYPFEGVIEDIRTFNGDSVRVDRSRMSDRGDSQTGKIVERSVIGAALGALIGAVAGGGKGAAIGAVIGAGGGASTVFIEGRDRLELARGTEMTIISGDPWNRR